MKITIDSSCEDSWIWTSSIIDAELSSNYSLNDSISLRPITCLHFCTKMLYIWKVIITENKMSDCILSRDGIHKRSTDSNLHAFLVEL